MQTVHIVSSSICYCCSSCCCYSVVHRTLVVSSFGKLLAIAAVIWADTHLSSIYMLFTRLLVLSSNIAAFTGL